MAIVSIHAPAWGATAVRRSGTCCGRVSIHAPAWGATLLSWQLLTRHTGFNPRARVGRDANKQWLELIYMLFQSRARVGATIEIRTVRKVFQSTRLRGRDHGR